MTLATISRQIQCSPIQSFVMKMFFNLFFFEKLAMDFDIYIMSFNLCMCFDIQLGIYRKVR